MSGILLVVFATAILNNRILYFWKSCLLCELEDSMIQLKSLSIEPLRDPKEFQLAADRRPALKRNLRKLGGPMILFGTDAASKALSNYFSKSIKAVTPEKELEALVNAQPAVCEEARAHLHLEESMPTRSE